MFTPIDFLVLFGFIFTIVFWWRTNEAKQIAHKAAKKSCQEVGVQFLDDSVVLRKFNMQRTASGRMGLVRIFQFEFSTTGEFRYKGIVELLGYRVKRVELEPHQI